MTNANILLAAPCLKGKGTTKSKSAAIEFLEKAKDRLLFEARDLDDSYKCYSMFISYQNHSYPIFSENTDLEILKFLVENCPESRKKLAGRYMKLCKNLNSACYGRARKYVLENLTHENAKDLYDILICEKEYKDAFKVAQKMFNGTLTSPEEMILPHMMIEGIGCEKKYR